MVRTPLDIKSARAGIELSPSPFNKQLLRSGLLDCDHDLLIKITPELEHVLVLRAGGEVALSIILLELHHDGEDVGLLGVLGGNRGLEFLHRAQLASECRPETV